MYESKETRSTIDIATLSDGELARVIVANEIANETDSRLVDELWRRLDSTLAKAAKAAAHKVEYDLTEEDALSEAYVAAWKVLPLYDASKGASLKTFLGIKLKYHFVDLWRQNVDYVAHHESYAEVCKWDDDDNPVGDSNYGDICRVVSKTYDREYHNRDAVDACSKVQLKVSVAKHRDCLDLLKEAYKLGEKNAVPYVAEKLGCSRQQVYNILKQVADQLPGDLAEEVRDFL
jgi:hypothetical protein